jgi:thymidylate synthase ThyX
VTPLRLELVYDGEFVRIPRGCGTPAAGQMEGTQLEQLAELAGRECYDSLGRGRSSAAFHQHILDVGHLSIYEHCPFTVAIPGAAHNVADILQFVNRPGVYMRVAPRGELRVSMNLRTLLDWHNWRPADTDPFPLPGALEDIGHRLAPALFPVVHPPESKPLTLVAPADDEERWITLRMVGSRGFSHELVRHGDRTAISQRSTRYVDESESEWVRHPLIRAACVTPHRDAGFIRASQQLYRDTVGVCEAYLRARNVDSGTARKQARGAARGWLGNALSTSLIFSASVAQWRRMLAARCHPAADAEIREVFAAALRALKTSRYAQRFEDLVLVPSPDGLGEVLEQQP